MSELNECIHDEQTGLGYVLIEDYYIPAIELPEDDDRPWKMGTDALGIFGKKPLLLNHLILTGKLHTYLADFNEQAQNRYRLIVRQIAGAEGVTENLKRRSRWDWIRAMNGIVSPAEVIIKSEMINV